MSKFKFLLKINESDNSPKVVLKSAGLHSVARMFL